MIAQMKKKVKSIVLPPLKRRSIMALHAKMRKAGPMADTSWHALCTECGDSGVVSDGKYCVPCHECQLSEDDSESDQ